MSAEYDHQFDVVFEMLGMLSEAVADISNRLSLQENRDWLRPGGGGGSALNWSVEGDDELFVPIPYGSPWPAPTLRQHWSVVGHMPPRNTPELSEDFSTNLVHVLTGIE